MIITALAPRLCISTAAFFALFLSVIFMSVRTPASKTFGVTTVDRGNNRSTSTETASSLSNVPPASATITGSTTSGILCFLTSLATVLIISNDDSMPVFAYATSKSDNIASIWLAIISAGKS